MSKSTCRCGKTWGGKKREHCAACHETFSGTTAGDLHRVGDHGVHDGPKRRRCLTVAEMELSKRLTRKDDGTWGLPGSFDREVQP